MQLGFLFAAALLGQTLSIKIDPALKDGQSDKKFFASNYPLDTRPVVDKKVLNKLKSDKEPYPALQGGAKFAEDFVKDENNDAGHWKAQFEYDALRKKMLQAEAEEKRAADKADKEGKDVEGAQKKVDDAKESSDAAKKESDAAKDSEDATKKKQADAAKKKEEESTKKVSKAEMEKKLVQATEDLDVQKKKFAECKLELDEAKDKVKELKAKVAAMDAKGAAEVKLWAEQSVAKVKASKLVAEAAAAKREAAALRLASAENTKAHLEKKLQKEKAESEHAQQNLAKERAEKEQAKADLEKASQHLQKLRGYAPDAQPAKSGAATPAIFISLALSVGVFAIF